MATPLLIEELKRKTQGGVVPPTTAQGAAFADLTAASNERLAQMNRGEFTQPMPPAQQPQRMGMEQDRPAATLAGINYLKGFTAPQPTAAAALRSVGGAIQSRSEDVAREQGVSVPQTQGTAAPSVGVPTSIARPAQEGVPPMLARPVDEGASEGQVVPTYDPTRQFGMQGGYTNPLAAGIEMAGGSRELAQNLQNLTAPKAQVQGTQGLTSVSGVPLQQYLKGGIQLDPQGRMPPPGATIRAEAFPEYEQEVAKFQARQEAKPDFGATVSDAEKRGERSFSTYVDLAGGNRDLARTMQVREREGLDPMTGRPKRAEDTRTPEQIELERLEIERRRQIIEEDKKPDATPRQKKRAEWEEMAEDMKADGMSDAEIAARRKAFLYGDRFDPYEFQEGGDTVSTEQAASDAEADSATSTYSEQQESGISRVMEANKISREEAIAALKKAGKLK